MSPVLCITSPHYDFDPTTLSHWRDEGFAVRFLPFGGDAQHLKSTLNGLADSLEAGESYGLIGASVLPSARHC